MCAEAEKSKDTTITIIVISAADQLRHTRIYNCTVFNVREASENYRRTTATLLIGSTNVHLIIAPIIRPKRMLYVGPQIEPSS